MKKICTLLCFTCIKLMLCAQDNKIALTLEHAIQMSLQESKLLKLDSGKIAEAKARYIQASNQLLPSASINGSYVRVSDNIAPFEIQNTSGGKFLLNSQVLNQFYSAISFGEILYSGHKTKLATASAKYLENASRMDAQQNKAEIVFNTINAYYNLYKTEQTKKAIEESIIQVKEHVRNIESYQKNGLALKNDVLKIELQLSSLNQSLIDIDAALDIACYNMSIMLGYAAGTTYQVATETFFQSSLDKSYDDYLSAGLMNRMDLKSMYSKIKAAETGVKSAKNNLYPTVSAGANYYNNRPNARAFPIEPAFKGTWDMRLTVSWNFSTLWTNKAKVRESKSVLQQTQASRDLMADGIKMEINADYLTYLKSKEKIKVSQAAVMQAEENYRIVNTQFKNNTALISDLTDANTLLLQTRINLLVDKADADVALYRLMKSSGSNYSINQ